MNSSQPHARYKPVNIMEGITGNTCLFEAPNIGLRQQRFDRREMAIQKKELAISRVQLERFLVNILKERFRTGSGYVYWPLLLLLLLPKPPKPLNIPMTSLAVSFVAFTVSIP